MCNICHWMKPTIEYCHIFTTVKFDIHYYECVVKVTCALTLFDLENLIRYHSTLYFIRQLHVQLDELIIFNTKQIDSLPVAITELQQGTFCDPVLGRVFHYTKSGWS